MSQPELGLTVAQQIDPGIRLTMDLGQNIDAVTAIDRRSSRFGRGLAMGILAGTAGLLGAVSSEVVGNDVPEAHADGLCPPGTVMVAWIDLNQNGLPDVGDRWDCQATTPPQPTSPPTPTTSPPPTGGGTGTTQPQPPRTTSPPTTSPNIDVNVDGDSWSITINKNTGDKVSGWDVDDNSPGLGEEGIVLLEQEMLARGLNPETMSDAQTLVAMTVNPNEWPLYLNDILSIPPTTTTSTTAASTTTTTVLSATTDAPATTEAATTVVTTEVQGNDSDQEATPINASIDDDSSSGGSANKLAVIALGAIGALGLGSIVLLARKRRKDEEPETPPQTFGESPVVGN